jgi:hypothetical protein
MLMPRIDSRQFEQTWVEVLSRQLAETDIAVQARERRQARVRQLSCGAAEAKWSELLDELQTAQKAAGNAVGNASPARARETSGTIQ